MSGGRKRASVADDIGSGAAAKDLGHGRHSEGCGARSSATGAEAHGPGSGRQHASDLRSPD